jgi:hypothetical protein
MKIYSVVQIGEHHTNHCEDYLVSAEIGTNRILCAVMDGCTMGEDSYFVSTLVGKLLRKIATQRSYQEFYSQSLPSSALADELRGVLKELMLELRQFKNRLLLDKNELLSTLILLIYDKKSREGQILVVGDGVVCIDEEITEYDQNNIPDYLGYHLAEDFDSWYAGLNQKQTFSNPSDISISTDGILTFTKFDDKAYQQVIEPISYLLKDKADAEIENMLKKKVMHLEREYGIKPTDDVAIIRLILTV